MDAPHRNWAGNYTFQATAWHYPESIEQLQNIVSRAERVRAIGSAHSFNDIADSPQTLISLANLNIAPQIDPATMTVTLSAGVKYGAICQQLHVAGYALHNLASLPHISVGGAVATATHGSGERNGNLASAVVGLELVKADGSLVMLRRDQDADFYGAVVGLGALGIVTRITLQLVSTFDMAQVVYEQMPLDQVLSHFDEIEAKAYSVSLFTDWRADSINQVWFKYRTQDGSFDAPPELFGAKLATTQHHPIDGVSAEACTPQLGEVGPWYQRLPHFRMDFTPSSGEELQTEYLVPRSNALAALTAVASMRRRIAPVLQVCEIRTIAADDLWLSQAYQTDCVGIHFTWQKDWQAVRQLLPEVEAKLEPLRAAPHWGKLFTMPADTLQAAYPKLSDFRQLSARYDPSGKFRNVFLDRYIYN